jgi:predicted regulator of Ras-like GTPase activity (Roadblock/LC7/MglB family)
MSLANLVQLVCNEGREARLEVDSGGKNGEIYFGQGNVVHAVAVGKKGEEAFGAVAGWTEGDFALEYEVATPEQTINRNWSSLLLSALHSLDEEHDARREYYEIIMGNLVTVDGVGELTITRPDGFLYACSEERQPAEAYRLAAFACAAAAEVSEALALGPFAQFVLYGDRGRIVVFGSGDECYSFSLANGADPERVGEAVRGLLKAIL